MSSNERQPLRTWTMRERAPHAADATEEHASVEWDQVRFDTLVWDRHDSSANDATHHPDTPEYSALIPIRIDERPYELFASCVVDMADARTDSTPREVKGAQYHFAILDSTHGASSKPPLASVSLSVVLRTDHYEGHANVERHDDHAPALPKGTGVALYAKLLDFIPSLAQRAPFHDIVQSRPLDGDSETWKQRFLPLLQQRGYTQRPATNGPLEYERWYGERSGTAR